VTDVDGFEGFCSARLAEDEATAQAAVHLAFRKWHVEPWYDGDFLPDRRTQRADVQGTTGYQVAESQAQPGQRPAPLLVPPKGMDASAAARIARQNVPGLPGYAAP
jgi:hypothetical protein